MSISIHQSLGSRFTALLRSFAQGDGLPFASALTEQDIQHAAEAEGVDFGSQDDDVYTPAVTLWAFISQVLSGRKSCVAAVARIIVLRVAMGLPTCSSATGAYCKARAKLPEPFLRRLTYEVGSQVEDQAPAHWRWRGRRALLVDGTTGTLPDTEANQKAYPQSRLQKRGLGFPMIRLVVLLTFATATIVGAALGPYKGKETGETALFRELFDQLRSGDVVVADRYYCSYFMIALLRQHGVDVAFRLHRSRHYDFRRGRRLGQADHVVEWQRPKRPKWMSQETYATMPETLTVRELRFNVEEPGFRTREIIVATTLLDDRTYSKSDIAELYHQRWQAELDLRAIKRTLGMERLTCKTPKMVRKELWAHLLGYNLVRKVAAQAAWERGLCPRQISFAATVQYLEAFRDLLNATDQHVLICCQMFEAIATHEVGDRPGRVEPRCIKRRQGNQYPTLKTPRDQARAELLDTAA
jgi:putative transposase